MTQKDRPSVINLGTYARTRDVVQNGNVGLAELSKIVMKVTLDKSTPDRLSDWDQKELTDSQVRYAALDAIMLLLIYQELENLPDLTQRYAMKDVVVGAPVDLVPIHGSVASMATRAATGIIVGDTQCESPTGIVPKQAKPGDASVVIKILGIYTPDLKLSNYQHTQSKT